MRPTTNKNIENLRRILNLLDEKKLLVKPLPRESERREIYEAYRAWKCRPMMPTPYDEVYIMSGADVVYVGCIRNVECFAREWKEGAILSGSENLRH